MFYFLAVENRVTLHRTEQVSVELGVKFFEHMQRSDLAESHSGFRLAF